MDKSQVEIWAMPLLRYMTGEAKAQALGSTLLADLNFVNLNAVGLLDSYPSKGGGIKTYTVNISVVTSTTFICAHIKEWG
jgi:hypothetical protein